MRCEELMTPAAGVLDPTDTAREVARRRRGLLPVQSNGCTSR